MGFNFLTWKEFSGPSACYFACSHEICCTLRGGTSTLPPNSLRLYLCRVTLRRIRGIQPATVLNASPNQSSWGGTTSGKKWLFFPHRQESPCMPLGDDTCELWFPRAKGWSPQMQAVTCSSAVGRPSEEEENCPEGEVRVASCQQ